MNETRDLGGGDRERERGSHSTSRGREGVQLRGPELLILWWELKITGFQKQSCRWQRRGHPVGGGYRCHPGSASLVERRKRRWRPLFRSRRPRREGGGQADLRSEEHSGERSPRRQQGREVGYCGAPDHLYYKGGMPSAKTSLIEAHPRYFLGPFGWSSRNHEQ